MPSYQAPAKDEVKLVSGGIQAKQGRTSVALQYADCVMCCPALEEDTRDENTVELDFDLFLFNPQADQIIIERKLGAAGEWGPVQTIDADTTDWTDPTTLKEGNEYYYRARFRVNGSPQLYSEYSISLEVWTDRILMITEVRDHESNLMAGALVMAFSENYIWQQIAETAAGENLPTLTYDHDTVLSRNVTGFIRCNRTDEDGQCNITIPGKPGKVSVCFVDPNEQTIGGDIKTHIDPKEA